MRAFLGVAAIAALASPAMAQEMDSAAPVADPLSWVPDPASIAMPVTVFEETRKARSDYEKYFYFHRADTDFETALSDIRECDLRARGLWDTDAVYGLPKERAVDPEDTFFAAISSPLLAGIVAALAAPADERRERRFTIRRCMFFKGYDRFGLPRELFDAFNYEATDDDLPELERQTMLAQQALLASGERPVTQVLGL